MNTKKFLNFSILEILFINIPVGVYGFAESLTCLSLCIYTYFFLLPVLNKVNIA
jgi:hypothetical protein